jgi:hypothetical protein
LSVLVYGYLIFPSVKWLFVISPEQREAFVGDSVNTITYISIGIFVAGLLAIVVLVSQLFKKIEANKWTEWGVKVLMINVGIEILTFLALYISVNTNLISLESSADMLESITNYNMYLNMTLQAVATTLIVFGGIASLKKIK